MWGEGRARDDKEVPEEAGKLSVVEFTVSRPLLGTLRSHGLKCLGSDSFSHVTVELCL